MTPQQNTPSDSSGAKVATGRVYLVGAGPGDPGLLTLRGLECLQQADLVLYDGLVNPLLLEHTQGTTERTRRQGEDGHKVLDQDAINRRLVEEARAGRTVVRLKGGDPLVFGRGAEEARVLAEAGVPFEIVPGITAATAAAAYAGIPLTHRQKASAVVLVTGHEDPAKQDSTIDYEALAKFTGTVVFYMGLDRLDEIVSRLLEAGRDPRTPAAVISHGTLPAQRTVMGELAELPEAVAVAELTAPSLIVVGECVSERDAIAWFESRPLMGRSVGITRPVGQAAGVASRLVQLGAEPVLMPTIEILPPESFEAVDVVLDRIGDYDWIVFTSANGVAGLLGRLWDRGDDLRRLRDCRLAAIGPATGEALAEYRLRADVVPEAYRAEELGAALSGLVDGARVLWARASRGRDVLCELLREAGASLEEVVVYRNEDVEAFSSETLARLAGGTLDWIGLSSPSIARGVARLTADRQVSLGSTRLASISPVTSQAAEEAGLDVAVEAVEYTWDGLLEAIVAAES
jgi:uroporphyrinogen III methyltransferase/synthase